MCRLRCLSAGGQGFRSAGRQQQVLVAPLDTGQIVIGRIEAAGVERFIGESVEQLPRRKQPVMIGASRVLAVHELPVGMAFHGHVGDKLQHIQVNAVVGHVGRGLDSQRPQARRARVFPDPGVLLEVHPQRSPAREVLRHLEAVCRSVARIVGVGANPEFQTPVGVRGLAVDPELEPALSGWWDVRWLQLLGLSAGIFAGGALEPG